MCGALMDSIRKFLIERRDIISYLFFGVCTTIINYLVFFPMYNCLHASIVTSNIVSWIVAVVFAFLTNKQYVFRSKDWTMSKTTAEFLRFAFCRVGSLIVETLLIYIAVHILFWNGNVLKILVGILVILLNYIGSKVFVFENKKEA